MDGLFEMKRSTGPQVFNKHHRSYPADAVYIGRGSPWGNPFTIGEDGDRGEVLRLYREYLEENPQIVRAAREQLAGCDLLCFCKPAACHGDILMEFMARDD